MKLGSVRVIVYLNPFATVKSQVFKQPWEKANYTLRQLNVGVRNVRNHVHAEVYRARAGI